MRRTLQSTQSLIVGSVVVIASCTINAPPEATTRATEASQDAGLPAMGRNSPQDKGNAPQGDGVAPTILLSVPEEGATVYAQWLLDSDNNRISRTMRVAFSEAMNTTIQTLEMSADESSIALPIVWEADGKAFVAPLPEQPFRYVRPLNPSQLRYDSSHRVDLRSLRDRSGEPLDIKTLGNGILDFKTLPQDPLLEHTCGHLREPVSATVALSAATAASPRVALPHKRYAMIFPDGAVEGSASFAIAQSGEFNSFMVSLFLDRAVRTIVTRMRDSAPIALSAAQETAPVCPYLTAVRKFAVVEGESYNLTFIGDDMSRKFELIFDQDQL